MRVGVQQVRFVSKSISIVAVGATARRKYSLVRSLIFAWYFLISPYSVQSSEHFSFSNKVKTVIHSWQQVGVWF